jgi:hypothetical protein
VTSGLKFLFMDETNTIRLQVEVYGLLRFIMVVKDGDTSIQQLKNLIEENILELYSFQSKVLWMKVSVFILDGYLPGSTSE